MATGNRYVEMPGEARLGDAVEDAESNESGRRSSHESGRRWSKESPQTQRTGQGRARRMFHSAEKAEEVKEAKPVGFLDVFQYMRTSLQGTEWYSSLAAWRIRSIMTGAACTSIMLCALMIALLLPDLSQILDFPHNVWTDLIMSVSMCIFVCELVALSLTDAHYLFSFFHLMDVIGTTSMIFDISFLLGSKANEPVMASKNSAQERIMLLRASRAARVGARAGRLTRVLRVCKFVADFGDDDKGKPTEESKVERTSIAHVISVRLSSLLATRVASLTIFLVMVMPLFEVMNFPQKDLALDAWVDQVTSVYQEDEEDEKSTRVELRKMAEFFSSHSYGPFDACAGHIRGEGVFICEKYYEDWGQVQTEPARGSFVLMVHTPSFLVRFDMTRPLKVKAFCDLLNCFFTILIMVVFGVALSTVVTDLAVTPLERMLGTVREMANTVFRFSSNLSAAEKDEQPEDLTDIDSAGEMVLLEKVVEKLASIALVQTQQDAIEDTEGLQEDDIGVLSMLKGTELRSAANMEEGNVVGRRGSRPVRLTPTLSTSVHGVDEDTYSSLSEFDVFILSPLQLNKLAFHALIAHPSGVVALSGEEGEDQLLQRFVLAIQKGYNPNPFHNFGHALDVLAGVVRMLKLVEADTFLSDLEQFSILVAALGHDLGHPGQNNGFLSETSHELAIRYNDMSPLENMHCSKLYEILAKPETAIFRLVSPDEYKEVRKVTVETILHTDMIGHQPLVKDLNLIYQVHQEAFRSSFQAVAPTAMSGGRRKTVRGQERQPTRSKVMPKEVQVMEPHEIFRMPENKLLIMNTILHSADVSNPARGWDVTQKWAGVCIEEFFQQGDQEKALGIPVQFLNDRENLNRPNSQIGFIEFMIAPFFAAQIWLWPILFESGENLSNNMGYWQDVWEEETKPSQEELDKVRNRVAKVRETLSCAAMRIMS